MSQLEMRNFDSHYHPNHSEMSAQERLLYNNNYNSHHHNNNNHHNSNHNHHNGSVDENHYQLPYAHLQQSPYLHHHLMNQHQHGSYSSDDHSSTYTARHLNGHAYPQTTPLDKYSHAYPARDDSTSRRSTRSTRTSGSGIVYRPRRRLYWVLALLALLLLIVAGAAIIVVYFAVLKQEPQIQAGADEVRRNKSEFLLSTDLDRSTKQPPYAIPTVGTSTAFRPRLPDLIPIKTQKFDAYWHPGDSRIFVSTLTNGTVIQVFGPKKSDGTVKSVYSLSVTDASGVTKSIRFLGQRNLASVVLASGVIVSYDWAANNIDMEVKVFEPFTKLAKGPISHLAIVEVGVRSYLMRQISKFMDDLRSPRDDPMSGNRQSSSKCFSRYPVSVRKCGGLYPYDGAFVQGVITSTDKPITLTALPWPKESDPCYEQDSSSPNYYLPIPLEMDGDNSTMIKQAYVASSARLFTELCNMINDQVFQEHHNLCSDMADKVRRKLARHQLLDVVFDSCSAILNALHTTCVAISGISSADNMPSLVEYSLIRSFNRRLSESFQAGLPSKMDLKTQVFCPSSLPLSSYQRTVDTRSSHNISKDVININCPDYPEITYVDLDHLLTNSRSSTSQYDLVKHKMRVCSICAFEKLVSAQIVSDEMLCNNTCSKTNVLEFFPQAYNVENKTYMEQDSVYCHDFLTSVDNSIDPIGRQCLGNCMSNLHVRFLIKEPDNGVLYYNQTMQCSELRSHACKIKFGK